MTLRRVAAASSSMPVSRASPSTASASISVMSLPFERGPSEKVPASLK
jgi:hypothetical protein